MNVVLKSGESSSFPQCNKAVKKNRLKMAIQSKLPNVEKVKAVQHTFIIHRLLNTLIFQSLILKEKIVITQNVHTLILSYDNSCSFSGKCTNVTSADTELQFGCHTVLLVSITNGYPGGEQ